MKAYLSLGALLVTLAACLGLQSMRLDSAQEKNGKLQQKVEQREAEYNALKEAADNQLLARDEAVKRYKLSIEQSQRANKKLARALEDAANDDEKFSQCMRIVISDAVFNQLPK